MALVNAKAAELTPAFATWSPPLDRYPELALDLLVALPNALGTDTISGYSGSKHCVRISYYRISCETRAFTRISLGFPKSNTHPLLGRYGSECLVPRGPVSRNRGQAFDMLVCWKTTFLPLLVGIVPLRAVVPDGTHCVFYLTVRNCYAIMKRHSNF